MIKHKQGTPDYFHRTWEQCGNQSRGGCQNVAHQSCGVQWHRSDTERVSNMTLFEPELTWRALWRTLAELLWRDEMDIWTADVWRDKCLLMAFNLFVMDQSNTQRETHGMNRNDGFETSCRFWACFPPGVWYKCKIRDLNCSPGAPLAIMTRCMHKSSR